MKIKVKLLRLYMENHNLTVEELAQEIEIGIAEIEKMLSGETVNEPTARKFIHYFGADKAAKLIDWDAIGKVNPFADETADKE